MNWMAVWDIRRLGLLVPLSLAGLLLITSLPVVAQATDTPDILMQKADALTRQGQLSEATRLYRQAIDGLQGTDNPARFTAMARLGEILLAQGQPDQAARWLGDAINGLNDAGHHEQMANVLVRVGNLQIRIGDPASALQSFQWISDLKDRLQDDRFLVVGRNGEALAYRQMKRLDEAEQAYTDALAAARRVGDRLMAAQVGSGLAGLQLQRGNKSQACRQFANVAKELQTLKQPRAAAGVQQEMQRIGCGK